MSKQQCRLVIRRIPCHTACLSPLFELLMANCPFYTYTSSEPCTTFMSCHGPHPPTCTSRPRSLAQKYPISSVAFCCSQKRKFFVHLILRAPIHHHFLENCDHMQAHDMLASANLTLWVCVICIELIHVHSLPWNCSHRNTYQGRGANFPRYHVHAFVVLGNAATGRRETEMLPMCIFGH
jgi:hypothetical protein